jgi:hypothetical protein
MSEAKEFILNFQIHAGRDGGLVVYENQIGQEDLRLVFGGNIEEFTTYAKARAEALMKEAADAKTPKEKPAVVQSQTVALSPAARPLTRFEQALNEAHGQTRDREEVA